MLALLSLALASESPLTVSGTALEYRVVDEDGAVDPYTFARRIGDDDTAQLYRTLNRQRRAVSLTGWIGGGVALYAGAMATAIGGLSGSPELTFIGLGALGTGLVTVPTATALHIAWGRELKRYDRWYDLADLQALTERYNASLGERHEPEVLALEIRSDGTRIDAWRGDERLLPGEFARLVGDSQTYALWNSARVGCHVTGWTLLGLGVVGLSNSAPAFGAILGAGPINGAQLAVASLSGAALLLGPLVVYAPKLLYNDLSRWYTLDEAEALAGRVGSLAPSPGPAVQIAVGPGSLTVLW